MAAVIEFLLKVRTYRFEIHSYTLFQKADDSKYLNIYVLNKLNFGFYMICVI